MSIEVKNVTFGYDSDEDIIENLSVTFEKGEFTAVLGPNGSGKSTLMKVILGILKKETGNITADGKNLAELTNTQRALIISYVPQTSDPDYGFTVEETVSMGRYAHHGRFKTKSTEDIKITADSMKKAGIYHLKDRKITEISGGERQRVNLARAFCQEAEYIILDEPVNHLDVRYQASVLSALKDSVPQKTVIAVMHDINLTSMFSENTVLINEGRIMASGKTSEVLTGENLKEVFGMDFKILTEGEERFFIPSVTHTD